MDKTRIELCEVTRENIRRVLMLKVKPDQEPFVATNAVSLAQAFVYPGRAWPRAIYADGEPVGFLMLDVIGPDHPEAESGQASYFLWRLMIGADHQGQGYGRASIGAVIEHVRTLPGARLLVTSYVPDGPGNPGPFYETLGFKPTGEVDEDGEIELSLEL